VDPKRLRKLGIGRWYGWLQHHLDALRESYWFFPVQISLFSGLLALGAIELDRSFLEGAKPWIPWLTEVSADGARSLLSTIAGSMITVTGVVFSSTLVALTLASSQFGPRLLRTFLRDRGSQFALGLFVSTFFYSMVVLRAVGSPEQIPYIAVAGAVVLTVASLFVLIYFVHHTATSIQASTVIAAVAREMREQIPTLFPEAGDAVVSPMLRSQDRLLLDRLEREGRVVRAQRDGYVRIVDDSALMEMATEHDLLIRLEVRPGSFVSERTVVARYLLRQQWSADRPESSLARAPDPAWLDAVAEELRASCILGDQRTAVQDLEFLTGQLSEMAVRALSPGVNDPKTAIECIHRLGAVVESVGRRAMPAGLRADRAGVLRVIAPATSFEAIVSSCFDSVRSYACGDPQVVLALLDAIERGCVACSDPERRAVLRGHARETLAEFESQRGARSERDRRRVESAYQRMLASLAKHPGRGGLPSAVSSTELGCASATPGSGSGSGAASHSDDAAEGIPCPPVLPVSVVGYPSGRM